MIMMTGSFTIAASPIWSGTARFTFPEIWRTIYCVF
jgi:hypothetical protein